MAAPVMKTGDELNRNVNFGYGDCMKLSLTKDLVEEELAVRESGEAMIQNRGPRPGLVMVR